jgi:hypothetical protein
MEEAETAWKSVMKRETIATLAEKMKEQRFLLKTETLKQWLQEKMVA